MRKSRKTIRIACLGTPSDYRTSLVPLIIQSLGYKIDWVSPVWADLLIYGSFYDVSAPRLRWLPRSWRSKAGQWVDWVEKELSKRRLPPVTLFHTAENLRHDHIQADFAISHDLNVNSERHFRLPYWMEVIDWSHEGIVGNKNPRYGELLKLERLQAPLGDQFLRRPQKAVLITSHLREPRASCYELIKKHIPIDGMGSYFDPTIRDHHRSGFLKKKILENYAFNLCPENGIYPGYVTEKIPEAFAAGCLPITCVDEAASVDFNLNAVMNLRKNIEEHLVFTQRGLFNKTVLKGCAEESLMIRRPSTTGLTEFLKCSGILAGSYR